jgi:ribonuclease/clavin/mitogillin
MAALRPPIGYRLIPLRTATLPPATHINCYLVGEQRALLIDPGSRFPSELRRLRSVLFSHRGRGGTLGALFLTHHHRDHCAGAANIAREFCLPIMAHRETLARVAPIATSAGVAVRTVDNGHEIPLDGGRVLQVLHTPGHALGHCCVFEPRERVLLSGDMILGDQTTLIDPAEGNMVDYLQSLSQLAQRDPSWILPAHGPIKHEGRQVVERLIGHRHWREAHIDSCVRREPIGQSTLELTRCAYSELVRHPLALLAAYRSTLTHLYKLADDGRVELKGTKWYPVDGGERCPRA